MGQGGEAFSRAAGRVGDLFLEVGLVTRLGAVVVGGVVAVVAVILLAVVRNAVHDDAEDTGAGAVELLEHGGGGAVEGVAGIDDDEDAVDAGGEEGGIRDDEGGAIEDDDVGGGLELGEELIHAGGGKDLSGVGGQGAAGEDAEVADGGGLEGGVKEGVAEEDVGEAEAVGEVEEAVLAGAAQVGVDEDDALAALGDDGSEVGGDGGLLPSPGPGLVTRMVLTAAAALANSRLVRRTRKASAVGERGCLATITPSASSSISEMSPMTGMPRVRVMSSGVLRVSSRNSIRKMTPTASIMPTTAASRVFCSFLGLMGELGATAGWTWVRLEVVWASATRICS